MSGSQPRDAAETATGLHAAADLAPGTVLAGRFEIEKLLGMGGMGVVYRARDRDLGITVAIKLLRAELAKRPEVFERFRQELLLARQVSSPQVVRIHDIARDGERWFISMDYVEGESLDRVLDRRGALPCDEAMAIARQLAEGLRVAHAGGIVHRDLKPANILVDAEGHARISDFGVARSLGGGGLTQTGTIVGTPDYLSPEQARGGPIDQRSDLYALGLCLYEMLGGQPAFAGSTAAESLGQRQLRPPPPLDTLRKDLPRWVVQLVDRLLRPQPRHRLPDAAAVIAAIDRRRVPLDPRAAVRIVVSLLALSLATAGALWWLQREPPPAPAPVAAAVVAQIAPVDRLVVMEESAGSGDQAMLAAVAEHLRHALAPGVAIADGERTALAQARLSFDTGSAVSDAQWFEALPASRVLRLRLRQDGEMTVLEARLVAADGSSRPLPAVSDRDITTGARTLATRAATALGQSTSADVWPAEQAQLQAFAAALALRRSGQAEAAAAAFAALTQQAPTYALAWLGLSDTAKQSGQRAQALDAALTGEALPSSPLHSEFQRRREMLAGEFDAALLRQRQLVGNQPGNLEARYALAELESEAGEFEAAIATLNELLQRDAQDPRAWFLLGKASILHGDPRPAVEDQLLRALLLFKRSRNRFGEAETTNALGVGYGRLGQTDDAEEQYRKAVELRRGLGDRRGTASTLRNLAQVATIRGRFDEAEANLGEARMLFEALGDTAGGAAVDNELGLLAEERGNYPAALESYLRALRGRERIGDAQGHAESLNNVGFAQYQLGNYDHARAYWVQAREAFAQLDDLNGTVRADQNLGLLAIQRGDWIGARRLLEESLREAQERQMHEEAAVSRRNLAELEIMEGRLDSAQAHIQQARALFAERDDQRGLVDADLLQMQLAIASGKPEQALHQLKGMQASLADSPPEQRALAALFEIQALLDAGRTEAAAEAGKRARELSAASGVRALLLRAELFRMSSATGPAAEKLDTEIDALGHLPLQLLWLERRLALALANRDERTAQQVATAARAYLRSHENYVRASRLRQPQASPVATGGNDDNPP